MYGLFQDGTLSAREPLRAGLDLTRRSIAALQSSTAAEKYSMRLRVADAQTAEMLSDLFGQPPADEVASVPPSPMLVATQPGQPGQPDQPDQPDQPVGPDPITSTEPPRPVPETNTAWSGLAGIFWYRRSLAFRVVVWLVLCLVAAVLIVVPIAIMALFPNHLTEIAVAYALIAFIWWLGRRWQLGTQHREREAVSPSEAAQATENPSPPVADDLSARGRAGCPGEAA